MLAYEQAPVGERQLEPSPVEYVQHIANTADPTEQWRLLGVIADRPPEQTAAYFDALVDFAGDPDSSDSLIVRLRAMEITASALKWTDTEHMSDRMAASRDRLATFLPEYFSTTTIPASVQHFEDTERVHNYAIVRYLASDEDFRVPICARDVYSTGHVDFMPGLSIIPSMFLERTFGFYDTATYEYQAAGPFRQPLMRKLLDTYPAVLRGEASWDDFAEISEFARVGRYNLHHDNHNRSGIRELYDTNRPEALQYARALNRLFDAADNLWHAFPGEPGLATGIVKRKLADLIPAITEHISNGGRTDAAIPLLNGGSLPLHLKAGEPLEVVEGLIHAFDTIGQVFQPGTTSVRSKDGRGYRMYRFIKDDTLLPIIQYIRPMGERAFDLDYEYGRHYEGVEASIGFIVDTNKGGLGMIPLDKRARGGGVISIRFDREARPNPDAEEGKLSLDIGSVLGNPKTFGTKAGRLIAWGNVLSERKKDESFQRITLNHSANFFSAQYGTASGFLELALDQDARMQSMLADRSAIQRLGGVGLVSRS